MTPKLSIYFYLFLARKNDFDLDGTIQNFTDFADEVVCATIQLPDDDTPVRLAEWENKLGSSRFRVVATDIKLSNNRFDGDLKTAALRGCTKSTPEQPRVYAIADADERFAPSNRPKWDEAAANLMRLPQYDGFMIPVVDLYQDEYHVRSDQLFGYKFRLHKDTVAKRGVMPEAEMGNGLFRTDMSDSTEPLNANGTLARFVPIMHDQQHRWPSVSSCLNNYPYVFHYGHLDKERRARLNREFWREHWKARSGWEPVMPLKAEEVEKVPLVRHQIALV